jgi:hypothetical protein
MLRLSPQYWSLTHDLLASPTSAVSITIPVRKAGTINLGKVTKAGIMKVMRSLGVVALIFFTILPSSFQSILVALAIGVVAILKNVLPVSIVVEPIKPKWIVSTEWPEGSYDDHPTLYRLWPLPK